MMFIYYTEYTAAVDLYNIHMCACDVSVQSVVYEIIISFMFVARKIHTYYTLYDY